MARPDWESTRRQLIETYRTLNHRVRGKSEEHLAADHQGSSVRSEIMTMRLAEFTFAKRLALALLGGAGESALAADDAPVDMSIGDDTPTRMLISQFGTARATTLNTMSGAPDDAWSGVVIGNKGMLDLANDLVEQDRAHIDRITRMLGT